MNNSRKRMIEYLIIIALIVFSSHYVMTLTVPIFNIFGELISVSLPFIFGSVIAFLLHTLVDRLEGYGIRRSIAVLIIFIVFIYIIVYLFVNLIPILIFQIENLADEIPDLIISLKASLDSFWQKYNFVPLKYQFNIDDIEYATNGLLDGLNINIFENLSSLFNTFNFIVITPIITYYVLYDYNNIKRSFNKFLMRHKKKFVRNFLCEADNKLGRYFRGLILVMNLLTIFTTLGFWIIGLDYPLLFGFIVGYTNVIPIVGPYIGGAPAVVFALTKSYKLALGALIVIVIMQTLESNILTPYIQSKSVKAHPLLILFTVFAFGRYFGLIGMIFAIPMLAIILLIIKYIRIYLRLNKIKKVKCRVEKLKI